MPTRLLPLVLFSLLGARVARCEEPSSVSPVESAVAHVRRGLEAYAFPHADVQSIQRELAFLGQDSTPDAAQALLREARYALALVHDLRISQSRLEKRRTRLRKKAKQARKKRGLDPEALESAQRQLELIGTKFTIQGAQSSRLAALSDAVVQALASKTDPAAVRVYSRSLRTERDPRVAQVLTQVLGLARDRSALPALIKALARPALRDDAHAALVQVHGTDLGKTPDAWRALSKREARSE